MQNRGVPCEDIKYKGTSGIFSDGINAPVISENIVSTVSTVRAVDMNVSKGQGEIAGNEENEENEENEGEFDICDTVLGKRKAVDYTKYPSLLDRRCEELDPDSALRPTIINACEEWEKISYKSLMSKGVGTFLDIDKQNDEKNAAFDLIDALSRSGALVIESASLHVVIAATHCFDKSLMDTIVRGNINPIERVERSALIMASTIHGLPVSEMVPGSELQRVLTYSPQLN